MGGRPSNYIEFYHMLYVNDICGYKESLVITTERVEYLYTLVERNFYIPLKLLAKHVCILRYVKVHLRNSLEAK